MLSSLFLIVDVIAAPSRAGRAILPKRVFQFVQNIGFNGEMAKVAAFFFRLGNFRLHFIAFITVKTITLNHQGVYPQPVKNMFESFFYGGGAGA